MAAGAQRTLQQEGTPSSAPLPPPNYGRGRRLALPTLSGGGALITVPVGTAPAPHTIPVGMVRVHPPAATLNVRDPFRVAGEGPGATTHPRSPAPINVNWVLRDSSPGVRLRLRAPFSCLLLSSSFCPSSIFRPLSAYRESLGHSLSSERPFCPSHPGLPCRPGILGLWAGAASRRPSSGEGWMDYPIHRPSRGSSRRTKGGPGPLPPSSGRPRRGGAAPAFVGVPTASLSAPRVSP
jgi:hypothetical protein